MRTRLAITGAVAVLFILFLALPAPISPVAYHPAKAPALTGTLTPNTQLQQAKLLALGQINGPEEVALDDKGNVYGGTIDGKIVKLYPDGKIETFANTHGRPLGMQFDQQQNLIVCDAYKGLLSIDQAGNITVLADSAQGVDFKFTDALDIADNGVIYFTDASDKFSQNEYLYDLLEARPHGRLFSYDPKTKQVKVLVNDLYFANGVALSQQQDFVLVNETYRYRIVRYWLKGPKAGSHDIFVDNLAGFPDNISSNGDGQFWLAMFTIRNASIDFLHAYPFLKAQLAKLPKFLWPKPQAYGLVLALNERGGILQSLHDPSGRHVQQITSAVEHAGHLYLGSLNNDRIGKLELK